jgi:hypothetical protein
MVSATAGGGHSFLGIPQRNRTPRLCIPQPAPPMGYRPMWQQRLPVLTARAEAAGCRTQQPDVPVRLGVFPLWESHQYGLHSGFP